MLTDLLWYTNTVPKKYNYRVFRAKTLNFNDVLDYRYSCGHEV